MAISLAETMQNRNINEVSFATWRLLSPSDLLRRAYERPILPSHNSDLSSKLAQPPYFGSTDTLVAEHTHAVVRDPQAQYGHIEVVDIDTRQQLGNHDRDELLTGSQLDRSASDDAVNEPISSNGPCSEPECDTLNSALAPRENRSTPYEAVVIESVAGTSATEIIDGESGIVDSDTADVNVPALDSDEPRSTLRKNRIARAARKAKRDYLINLDTLAPDEAATLVLPLCELEGRLSVDELTIPGQFPSEHSTGLVTNDPPSGTQQSDCRATHDDKGQSKKQEGPSSHFADVHEDTSEVWLVADFTTAVEDLSAQRHIEDAVAPTYDLLVAETVVLSPVDSISDDAKSDDGSQSNAEASEYRESPSETHDHAVAPAELAALPADDHVNTTKHDLDPACADAGSDTSVAGSVGIALPPAEQAVHRQLDAQALDAVSPEHPATVDEQSDASGSDCFLAHGQDLEHSREPNIGYSNISVAHTLPLVASDESARELSAKLKSDRRNGEHATSDAKRSIRKNKMPIGTCDHSREAIKRNAKVEARHERDPPPSEQGEQRVNRRRQAVGTLEHSGRSKSSKAPKIEQHIAPDPRPESRRADVMQPALVRRRHHDRLDRNRRPTATRHSSKQDLLSSRWLGLPKVLDIANAELVHRNPRSKAHDADHRSAKEARETSPPSSSQPLDTREQHAASELPKPTAKDAASRTKQRHHRRRSEPERHQSAEENHRRGRSMNEHIGRRPHSFLAGLISK